MGLRGWLRRLEKEAEGEMVFVPRKDGTFKRFPQSALQESFMTNMSRPRRGSLQVDASRARLPPPGLRVGPEGSSIRP